MATKGSSLLVLVFFTLFNVLEYAEPVLARTASVQYNDENKVEATRPLSLRGGPKA